MSPSETTAQTVQTAQAAQTHQPTVAELFKQVTQMQEQLKAKEAEDKKAAAAQAAPAEAKIDWDKMEEKDIFDLSIPIPAIEQEVPDYLEFMLKDKSYVRRWIHVLPERLGPCLASGYSYVTKDDIDDRYPHPLQFDAEGHYKFGDVVALKILKSRYYPAIRRNHMKTMALHGRARVNSRLQDDISKNPRIESAIRRGALSFYDQEAIEESGPDLEAVTL
jgi:hypothetical protein